jgi:hypothetical protein
MSRKIVALAALAFTGAILAVPDPSFARGGGIRGGFHGGLRAPFIARNVRTNFFRPGSIRTNAVQFRLPAGPQLGHGLARITVRAPFAHLGRRHHGAYIYGSGYPITTDNEASYIGTPYDPGESIPVYGPVPATEQADPPALRSMPRLSGTRDENQDACRSERVTVPAAEGEREITVVRC